MLNQDRTLVIQTDDPSYRERIDALVVELAPQDSLPDERQVYWAFQAEGGCEGLALWQRDIVREIVRASIDHLDAYRVLSKHAERMGREEGHAQLQAHLKAGRKRETFGTGRKYPFRPSATLTVACEILGDPSLTKERALAFIHDPSAAAWDVERRMRNTG